MAAKKSNQIVIQKSKGIGKKPYSIFIDQKRYEDNKAHYTADGYKAFYPEDKGETAKEPKNKESKENPTIKESMTEMFDSVDEKGFIETIKDKKAVGEKANKEDIG